MEETILKVSNRIVSLLGLRSDLHKQRHEIRARLFELYEDPDDGFLGDESGHLYYDARAIARAMVTLKTPLSRLKEIARFLNGGRSAIMSYVLFDILHSAVNECANDLDAWKKMKMKIREGIEHFHNPAEDLARLPNADDFILKRMKSICEELELENALNSPDVLSSIEKRLKGIYEEHPDGERVIRELGHLASTLILNKCKGDPLQRTLSQIRSIYDARDATTVVTVFAILLILDRASQKPELAEACAYFREHVMATEAEMLS